MILVEFGSFACWRKGRPSKTVRRSILAELSSFACCVVQVEPGDFLSYVNGVDVRD